MGHETILLCDSDLGEIVGKVESDLDVHDSDNLRFNVDHQKIYIFDKKSQLAI